MFRLFPRRPLDPAASRLLVAFTMVSVPTVAGAQSAPDSVPAAPAPVAPSPAAPPPAATAPVALSPAAPVPVTPAPAAGDAASSSASSNALSATAATPVGSSASAPVIEPPPDTRLAGWADDAFFLRESTDNFRLYIQGRANIDAYIPFGPGVADLGPGNQLKSTVFLRRIRPEIAGEFLRVFQFKIEGDWGQSTSDNTNGQTAGLNCTPAATGTPACAPRTSAIEAPTQKPQALDVYINWAAAKYFNIEVGQFKIPFTLENRTSENYTPFLEASLPVRDVAVPVNRDLGAMVWGETQGREVYYSLGVFNGDGPNRLNPDNRYDAIGRVFGHPLASFGSPLKDLQIGVSGRVGARDSHYVGYDYTAMSTQGGYAFWKPTYTDASGVFTHVIPSGSQRAIAGELYVPVDPVELTAELVYIDNHTREAADGNQLSPFTSRLGSLHGYSYYAQLGVWLLGDRMMIGRPGYSNPTHIDLTRPQRPPSQGLEALVKFEQIRLTYEGNSRGGTPSGIDGDIKVDALSFGANYWFTRHVRVSANYGLYDFPGSAPVSPSPAGTTKQTSSQRATAPAQNLAKGIDDDTRTNGHLLHELMFRLGIAI